MYADQSLYNHTCIMQIHVVYDLNRYLTDVTCTRPPDKSVYWKIIFFLAHLSRRLIGELIVYQ